MAVATRFGTSVRWTPPRWLLLAAGAGFGYVMLASGGSVLIVAAFVGGSGAVLAELAIGRRRTRANAPQPVGGACALSPGVA